MEDGDQKVLATEESSQSRMFLEAASPARRGLASRETLTRLLCRKGCKGWSKLRAKDALSEFTMTEGLQLK